MQKLFCVFVTFLAVTISMSAQSILVNGRVEDQKGEPLVGVAVYEDGRTSEGTMTDIDGNYSINVSSTKAVLVYSCLGYKEKRMTVGLRKTLNVFLEEESLSLEGAEVVSVGYGTVAKRDLTGSVSKVDMGEMLKVSVPNFDQALTGKVAGVVVSTADGALGAEANITIRGNNSLTQSSAPLYIIDGFPTESSMAASLNSSDIESIDILKDASATAIYGARGANGVIVITTRQGMEGKPKVNFSSSWTMNRNSGKVDLMDGYDFVRLQTEIYELNNATNPYLKPDDADLAAGVTAYSVEDYKNLPWTDWQDEIYRTALTQNYNVSVSGGSKEIGNRYNVSFSAMDQDGIIVNSNFQRYQGKINFNQKLGKRVSLDLLVNYSHSVTGGVTPTDAQNGSVASGWLMYSVWSYRPLKPIAQTGEDVLEDTLIDDDVTGANDYRFNPSKTVRNEHRKTIVDYLNANGSITWEIVDDLKLKISGGYSMNKRTREIFNGSETYSGYPGSSSGKGVNGSIFWTNKTSWVNENTLTWVKRVNRAHNFNLLGGFTMQGEDYQYHGTSATHITAESLGLAGMHTGKYQVVTPYYYDWMLLSGLFRLNYNYKYRYYLTASFRADGSSKFSEGNRWGYFPSVGLSWNFNREKWLKDVSWLSNGKLRASWGLTGNNRTTTPYDYYGRMDVLPGSTSSFDYVFDGTNVSGYYPSQIPNKDLKWETTQQWNVGVDVAFIDSRIKLTADWYLKDTRDLLLQATVPASSGYKTAMLNIGSMRNQGVELTADFVPVSRENFQWNINFNIAFNRNTVTGLVNDQLSLLRSISWETKFNNQYPYITQVGKPSGMMYGYVYEGTYRMEDFDGDVLKEGVPYMSSVGKEGVRPGDPKYMDVNQDGVVDENDQSIIGYGQPLHTGGFGTSMTFHGFDFNMFFSWSYGNDILNANRLYFENGTQTTQINQLKSYNDRWTTDNQDSDIPRVGANGMFVYSSRVVEDGSFLKLRNISLGYTFPRETLRKMHFDTFRVYVSADNILTFTKYSGPDPEVSTKSSVLTPGFDWSAYPRAFGLTAGIQFTF